MNVSTGLLTVEEFLQLPAPKEGHLELHHGEVVRMPPPKWGHQEIQALIMALLMQLAREYKVRMEMAFRPSPEHEVWVADVGMVSSERAAATGYDEYLTGAPDLVVEVLSPSNTVDEINDKMNVCTANGCVSFWVVDPKFKQVSVTEGDVTRHYRGPAFVSCCLFDGDVPAQEIFPSNTDDVRSH